MRLARSPEARWMLGAAGTVALALTLLLFHHVRYYWNGDTSAAYYGWWYHLGEMVRHGQWSPIDPTTWKNGNLAAEGQWALWNPLIIALGLLTNGVHQAMALTTVVKILVAVGGALGVFRVARSYGAALPAAYAAAVAAPMGGVTQYLDLPSWWAGQLIWALLPWVWWAVRRTTLRGASPVLPLVLGYLLVTVGYVYSTIMLIVVLVACLADVWIARDRRALFRLVAIGALLGLVAVTVYLPGVLTSSVTARSQEYRFGGELSTNPLQLLAGVLPTSAVPDPSTLLAPYTYLVWFLPIVVWLDWRRLRADWRPLGGLLAMAGVTLILVDGLGQFGPLRWPLRLAPFLVEAIVVLVAVTWTRYGVRRPSRRRLGWSLAWVAAAAVLSVLWADSQWAGHVVAVVVVAAGLVLLWLLIRAGRPAQAALAAGAVTVVLMLVQHVVYPDLPSPNRHPPTTLAGYQSQLAGAEGDAMQVGSDDNLMQHDPDADDLLLGSAWYLNPHRMQSTYTTISFLPFKLRYCAYYQGDTCAAALPSLFSIEPTTGERRVDLLGVSTLMLIDRDFTRGRLDHPPSGWHVAARTAHTTLWVRDHPLPGAGSVAWTSPGTRVSEVAVSDARTSFHVDHVPAGGGTVVLSLLDWPGYSTSSGSLADPVDGYLVTVHVPASAEGHSVQVGFRTPGWVLELACWVLALVAGAAWCVGYALQRRRAREGRVR